MPDKRKPARPLVSNPMFLNPSQAVYWLMPRGILFLLWMYAFIASSPRIVGQ